MMKKYLVAVLTLICIGASAHKKTDTDAGQTKIDSLKIVCSELKSEVAGLKNELKDARREINSVKDELAASQSELVRSNQELCAQMKALAEALSECAAGQQNSPEFVENGDFLNGLAVAKNKIGLYGVINTGGEVVIPFEYEDIYYVPSLHLFRARKTSGWGFINESGEEKTKFGYEDIKYREEKNTSIFIVKENGKLGVLNSELSSIIACKYDDIFWYGDESGCYVLCQGRKYALAKPDGSLVTSFSYDVNNGILFDGDMGYYVWYTHRVGGEEVYVNMSGSEKRIY